MCQEIALCQDVCELLFRIFQLQHEFLRRDPKDTGAHGRNPNHCIPRNDRDPVVLPDLRGEVLDVGIRSLSFGGVYDVDVRMVGSRAGISGSPEPIKDDHSVLSGKTAEVGESVQEMFPRGAEAVPGKLPELRFSEDKVVRTPAA